MLQITQVVLERKHRELCGLMEHSLENLSARFSAGVPKTYHKAAQVTPLKNRRTQNLHDTFAKSSMSAAVEYWNWRRLRTVQKT